MRVFIETERQLQERYLLEVLDADRHEEGLLDFGYKVVADGNPNWHETGYVSMLALLNARPPNKEQFLQEVKKRSQKDPSGREPCYWVCVGEQNKGVVALVDTTKHSDESAIGNLVGIASTSGADKAATRPWGSEIVAALVGWLCKNHGHHLIAAWGQTGPGRNVLLRSSFKRAGQTDRYEYLCKSG